MVDNTASAMAEIHCWVMKPSGSAPDYEFTWSWGQWEKAGRIIAGNCTTRAGSMGDATFRLLRRDRNEPENNFEFNTTTTNIIAGCYVCVISGTAAPTVATMLWCGWIVGIEQEILSDTTDGFGTVHALELGHLLDRQQVTGWARKKADSGYPDPINSPPTANIAGTGQVVIGNAVLGDDGNGNAVYLFARLPADCGTESAKLWTRWRLLRHLIKICGGSTNTKLPPLKLTCLDQGASAVTAGTELSATPPTGSDTAIYLDGTDQPEVFNLEEPTFKGQLDLLIPKSRGFGWRLDVQQSFWVIVPYSIADVSDYEIPVNSTAAALSLTDEPIKSVSLSENAADAYDRVTIEGSRIVWCGTVSFQDKNFDKGWTGDQLTDYKEAGSDDAGDETKNRSLRAAPGLSDVFTRFILLPSTGGGSSGNGDLAVKNDPGSSDSSSGSDEAFCMHIETSGSSLAAITMTTQTRSRCPYFPTMKILRNIPWPVGLISDNTDNRDAAALACPQYMQPQIFRFHKTAYGADYKWRHLNADNGSEDELAIKLQVAVDDSGPVIRIETNPPELLAANSADYTDMNIADVDPETDERAIDWRHLYVTLAIESDQRVSATKDRVEGKTPRRTLIIRDESLHCWAIHKGTILSVTDPSSDTGIDRVTHTNEARQRAFLIRNDFSLAYKRVRQVAAFAFRKRSAISIVRARPDQLPEWAYIGRLITDVTEPSGGSHTVNTVIEEISRDFGGSPSLTVTTDIPGLLSFGGTSSSATSGGAVSCANGGTVAQQVLRLNDRMNETDRDTARIPIITSRGGGVPVKNNMLKIIDSATILSAGGTTYYGINRKSTALTSVASAWDPNSVGSTAGLFTAETGVGRAFLYIDGELQADMVLVLLDSTQPITYALLQDDYCVTKTTVSLPVGAGPDTVTLYVPLFM